MSDLGVLRARGEEIKFLKDFVDKISTFTRETTVIARIYEHLFSNIKLANIFKILLAQL